MTLVDLDVRKIILLQASEVKRADLSRLNRFIPKHISHPAHGPNQLG
jgi:hypothetical protein